MLSHKVSTINFISHWRPTDDDTSPTAAPEAMATQQRPQTRDDYLPEAESPLITIAMKSNIGRLTKPKVTLAGFYGNSIGLNEGYI